MGAPPKNPADKIRKFLAEKDISQSLLALEADVVPSQLSMILTGDRLLTPSNIMKLSKYIGISEDEWSKEAQEYKLWHQSPEGQRYLKRKLKNISSEELGVGVMVDTQSVFAQQNEFLTIDPFEQKYLQPASFDLRAGRLVRREPGLEQGLGKDVKLNPGQGALIESLEEVTLSEEITARISIPSKLAHEFIYVSFGLQIDPGFKGKIVAAFENRGPEPWIVTLGDTVIYSIEFHALTASPTRRLLDLRPPDSMPTIHKKTTDQRIETS